MSVSGLGKRTVIGAVWSQLGLVANLTLTFGFYILITRSLSPEARGTFDVYTSIMGIAVLVTQLGLHSALIRFAPETHSPQDAHRRRVLFLRFLRHRLIVCALIAIVVVVWHMWVAHILNAPLFDQVWPYFIIALAANQILDIVVAALQSNIRMRAASLLQTGRVGFNLVFTGLIFVWIGPAPQRIVYAMTISVSIVAIVGLMYVLRVNPAAALAQTAALPHDRTTYRYAFGAWLISLTTFGLANQSDVLLINWILNDKEQVAFYNTAYLLFSQFYAGLGGWTAIMMPALTSALELRGVEGIRRAWLPFAKLQVLIFVPASFLLARTGPSIVHALFGERYASSGVVLSAFGLLYLIGLLATVTPYHILFVAGHMRKLLIVRLGAGLISIVLDLILLPRLGIWGAVIATCTAAICIYWIEFILTRRLFGVDYPLSFAIKITLASALAVASTLWLPWQGNVLDLIVSVAQTGLLFAALLALLKPLQQDELNIIAHISPQIAKPLRRLVH